MVSVYFHAIDIFVCDFIFKDMRHQTEWEKSKSEKLRCCPVLSKSEPSLLRKSNTLREVSLYMFLILSCF